MAKLVLVDSYNRETVADRLVEENLTAEVATDKAKEYNENNPHSDWFAKVVPDDYKLWGGIAEFI